MRAVAKPAATPAPRWPLAAILAISAVVYVNALQNALLWDDQYLIVDNPQIKDWHRVGNLLWSDLFPKVLPSGYYRPLQAFTNMVDYHLWGLQPFGYHLTSVVLHAATALLLYRFGVTLLADWAAALIAALLFAVHPIHTEAVTYVAGRSDPLAALCMLASLMAFLADRRRPISRWRAASLVAFVLALLAREAAMVLVLLLVVVDLSVVARDGERITVTALLVRYVPYALVLGLYLALRAAALPSDPIPGPPADVPLSLRLLTLPRVIIQYLALLVVPLDLHMERLVQPATSLADPITAGTTLIVLAGLVAAVRVRHRAWPVTFGVAWFLVALIPVSNVVPLATFMAEHWLYVPSMGLFLAVGWGAARAAERGWQQPVATAVLIALAAYGALTIRRNQDWRDEIVLYESTVRLAPHSSRAWTNLAHAYRERGDGAKAEAAYQQALQQFAAAPATAGTGGTSIDRPGAQRIVAQQLAVVANIYRQLGRHELAAQEFRRAVQLNPADGSAYNNLGLTLEAMNRPQEAREAFEAAIRIDPEFAAAHSNLGNHYFRLGDLDAALRLYKDAIILNPDYAEAYNNLGSAYFRMGQVEQAVNAYADALRRNPDLTEARRNLEVVTRAGGTAGAATAPSAADTLPSARPAN